MTRFPSALLQRPLLLVFLVALLVRLGVLLQVVGTPPWYWERWDQSDMDTFLKVAHQILEGDLLVHTPYHPLHQWHRMVASPEQWEGWYEPHVFHQVPGYYYALAFLLKVLGGSLAAVKVVQMFLGAVHAVLLGVVGTRLMGKSGGLSVGLLAAVYGPFVAIEPLLLREGLGLLLTTCGLYLVLCAETGRSSRGALGTLWTSGRWLAAGVTLGLGAITKETGFISFAAILLWTLARTVAGRSRLRWAAVGGLVVGFVAGISPLLLRNLLVGAALLAFSPQGAVNFAMANAADTKSGGVGFSVPRSLADIMEQSHGRLWPAVTATLDTYGGHLDMLADKVAAKFTAIWSNVEVPDNISYEYIARFSTILAMLPRFVCIWELAVVGFLVWLLARGWRRVAPRSGEAAADPSVPGASVPFPPRYMALIVTLLVLHVTAQSFAPVMARYRLVIVPFLMLPAGWTLAQGVAWLWHRQWRRVAGLAGGLVAAVALWHAWPPHPFLTGQAVRAADFIVGASLLAQQGQVDAARKEFEAGESYLRARGQFDQEFMLLEARRAILGPYDRSDEGRDRP